MDSTHIVNHAQLADWPGPERLLRLPHLHASFIISLAALGGHLELSENFAWMATLPTVLALGTAVALEVAAYYLPLVDNLLDTIAAPAAVVAETIVGASVFTDMSPVMQSGLWPSLPVEAPQASLPPQWQCSGVAAPPPPVAWAIL